MLQYWNADRKEFNCLEPAAEQSRNEDGHKPGSIIVTHTAPPLSWDRVWVCGGARVQGCSTPLTFWKMSEGTAHLGSEPGKCQEGISERSQEKKAIQTAISNKLLLWATVSDPRREPGKWWQASPLLQRDARGVIHQQQPTGRVGVTSQPIHG